MTKAEPQQISYDPVDHPKEGAINKSGPYSLYPGPWVKSPKGILKILISYKLKTTFRLNSVSWVSVLYNK